MHFDLLVLIKSIGLLGVLAIVFSESGLLIGFFLPGDSLLFTAGFLASQNIMNIYSLLIGSFICAVLGDNVGYFTGHKFGRKLFSKEDSWLFHKKHIIKTQKFYQKHGKKTIVLARFVPIVRTFAPIVAGVGDMHYRTFMFYNLIGGFAWTVSMILLGFFLGKSLPAEAVDKYLLPIMAAIVILSLIPSVIHVIQEKRASKE